MIFAIRKVAFWIRKNFIFLLKKIILIIFILLKKILSEKNYYNSLLYLFHLSPLKFKGYSLENNLDIINKIIQKHSCNTLLDYGCGKAFLYSKKIYNKLIKKYFLYDPYYFRYMKKPQEKYDITVCTDVMEHVKITDINNVIKNINNYSKKVIFFSISTIVAKKKLPDGSNAHVSLLKKTQWIKRIKKFSKKKIIYLRFNSDNKVYNIIT